MESINSGKVHHHNALQFALGKSAIYLIPLWKASVHCQGIFASEELKFCKWTNSKALHTQSQGLS